MHWKTPGISASSAAPNWPVRETATVIVQGSSCHFERVIESTLNEGRLYAAKWEQVGVKTPPVSEMKSFEDVKNAFAVQLSNSISMMVKISDVKDEVFAKGFPTPLISSTIEGCLESGRDITQGGAKYNHSTVSAHGSGHGGQFSGCDPMGRF